MSKGCLTIFPEAIDGLSRVQIEVPDEVVSQELAEIFVALATNLIGEDSRSKTAAILLECPTRAAPGLKDELEIAGVEVHLGDTHGVAAKVGLGSRRVAVNDVKLEQLPTVLRRCWQYAPLLFGVPDGPDLLSMGQELLSFSRDDLQRWHALATVFYHGAWLAYYARDLSPDALLSTVRATIESRGWQAEISDEPM